VVGPWPPLRLGWTGAPVGAIAAVAEEALFRRLAYARLLRFGATAAVVGSALAFALLHVPLYGIEVLPVDLGAGLLLSWQRWASGTWTVPAATHAAAELLAVIR
jgi:membrane protease YdiL (CAAX protease family)